jgi:hypothetical protein
MNTQWRNDEENKQEMTTLYIPNTHLTARKKQKMVKMARIE